MREAKDKQQTEAGAASSATKAASKELERRDHYLSSLIQRAKIGADGEEKKMEEPREPRPSVEAPEKHLEKRQAHQPQQPKEEKEEKGPAAGDGDAAGGVGNEKADGEVEQNVRIRAADMPPALQKCAFRCAWEALAAMPKLDSKRLALALKKEFDSAYGPAWHCIVGTSFGSYVTHSLGGFLYFSIDKVYILLFRTAVEPLPH